jgi:hypothetical protein
MRCNETVNNVSGTNENSLNDTWSEVLRFAYKNESDARNAIEQGIASSIPAALRFIDQFVYTVNATGSHSVGRFDTVAVLGNQTWAFNYLTGSEAFTLVNEIATGRRVNVWENRSLTYNQIVNQVGGKVNSTKV